MAEVERIALRRATAVIRTGSVTVRPSRGQLLAPLVQLAIAAGAIALIVLLLDRLPLAVLALLLMVGVFLGPTAALGFVFGLFGSSVVVDGGKQSARWQQGFLGLGIGTTESMAFARIDHVAVSGDYDDELTDGGRPDVVTWDVELVRDDGNRRTVGSVLCARPLADEGLARANDLAAAVGALAGAALRAAELPAEEFAVDVAETDAERPRRRRRRLARASLPPPNQATGDCRRRTGVGAAARRAVVARSRRTTRPWHGVAASSMSSGASPRSPPSSRTRSRPRPLCCGCSSRSCTSRRSRGPPRPGCGWWWIAARRSSTGASLPADAASSVCHRVATWRSCEYGEHPAWQGSAPGERVLRLGPSATPLPGGARLIPSLREKCGGMGVFAPGEDVARLTFFGLHSLQHRGQESAGNRHG